MTINSQETNLGSPHFFVFTHEPTYCAGCRQNHSTAQHFITSVGTRLTERRRMFVNTADNCQYQTVPRFLRVVVCLSPASMRRASHDSTKLWQSVSRKVAGSSVLWYRRRFFLLDGLHLKSRVGMSVSRRRLQSTLNSRNVRNRTYTLSTFQ